MWVTNFTNRSAVALRMVTSLLFPRKQNINTELDAGGRRARVGAGWKMKMRFVVDSCGTMGLSPGWSRKGGGEGGGCHIRSCVMLGCRGN